MSNAVHSCYVCVVRAWSLLVVVVATGCAFRAKTPMKPPQCTTYVECESHDQQRVEIIGTYTVWSARPGHSADDAKSRQVRIVLGASTSGPFLEAGSDKRHLRSREEIAKFRARRVRVIGTFVRRMPQTKPPDEAQLAGSCISDVESIQLD